MAVLGKAVLIKLMVGLLKPDKGRTQILGKHVNNLGRKRWTHWNFFSKQCPVRQYERI